MTERMGETVPLYKTMAPLRELLRRYRAYFKRRDFRTALYLSMVYFAASVVAAFYAINYANEVASNYVTDLVLSNVPAFEVDGLFGYGTILLIALIVFLVFAHPRRMSFTLNSLATLFFIRSGFNTLTHLGPFPTLPPNGDWGTLMSHFLFGSDYFFSGHVAVCFLMALLFWDDQILRNAFLVFSVFMSVVVLLGHYHYSIDVASAYFITYTIYVMCLKFFPKSLAIFRSDHALSS